MSAVQTKNYQPPVINVIEIVVEEAALSGMTTGDIED